MKAADYTYVMVTREFGFPIFIAPTGLRQIAEVTDNIREAQRWTEKDTQSSKIKYFQAVTGFNGLTFEKLC